MEVMKLKKARSQCYPGYPPNHEITVHFCTLNKITLFTMGEIFIFFLYFRIFTIFYKYMKNKIDILENYIYIFLIVNIVNL